MNRYLHFFAVLLVPTFISCTQVNEIPISTEIHLNSKSTQVDLFGEHIISTTLYERDIAISPKLDQIVFTLGDFRQNRRCLVSLKKAGDSSWSDIEVLSISGDYHDIEPFFYDRGTRLYFVSNRPIYGDSSRSDYNIWFSDLIEGEWRTPYPLDSIINTRGDEYYPSISNDGTLYFTASRESGIGSEDIFKSEWVDGQYQSPEPLPEQINFAGFDFNAFIDPEENYIIFSSFGRDDGYGGGDLYISRKDAEGNWLPAKNLGPEVNSNKLDYCPYVDPESINLYFTSERLDLNNDRIYDADQLREMAYDTRNGFGNIYRIGLDYLTK